MKATLLFGLLALITSNGAAAGGYHVTDRIVGPDGGWDYASYDTLRDRVLVARGAAVNAFDLKTHKVNPSLAPAAWGQRWIRGQSISRPETEPCSFH